MCALNLVLEVVLLLCVRVCAQLWGDEVKGTPLTLAFLAAGTLYVGRRCACRALRRRAGDGLTLHRAILVKREKHNTLFKE